VLISSHDFILVIGVSSHASSLLNLIFCELLAFFSSALCLCFIVSLHSINLIAIIYFSLRHYQSPWQCYLSMSSHPLSLAASLPWWMTQAVTWLCIHRMLGESEDRSSEFSKCSPISSVYSPTWSRRGKFKVSISATLLAPKCGRTISEPISANRQPHCSLSCG